MDSVTAGGPGLVAVGWGFSGDDLRAAVWTSSDGLSWSRVPDDEAVLGGAGIRRAMESVAAGGPGLVAVGSEFLDGDDAAVWTSADGLSWSRVPDDEAVLGGAGFQVMESVTAAGPGLVGVGRDESDAAVWTSADGLSWSRVSHDEAVLGGAGFQVMESVTGGGPGLVAVGSDMPVDDLSDAAVWVAPTEG